MGQDDSVFLFWILERLSPVVFRRSCTKQPTMLFNRVLLLSMYLLYRVSHSMWANELLWQEISSSICLCVYFSVCVGYTDRHICTKN